MRPGRGVAALVLVTAALAGCLDTEPEGSVSVYLGGRTDGEIQELHLTVTEAHVRTADGDTANGSRVGGDTRGDAPGTRVALVGENGDRGESQVPHFEEAAGWQAVVEQPEGVDVAFHEDEDATTFLGEQSLGPGEYRAVGLLVEDAYAIDADGNETDVEIVDAAARAEENLSVEQERETRIVLTLDVGESLDEDEEGGWRLSPTFSRVQVDTVDDVASGDEAHERGQPAQIGE